jgi:hypothetical protein
MSLVRLRCEQKWSEFVPSNREGSVKVCLFCRIIVLKGSTETRMIKRCGKKSNAQEQCSWFMIKPLRAEKVSSVIYMSKTHHLV